VGSGHFLVSGLNELIAIKHDLKILQFRRNSQRIKEYSIEISNDELILLDIETEELFDYKLNQKGNIKPELQAMQETLFHEKETIIENCLFGVDINPNSVKICRLRLWIELLKNAYYTKESNYADLETLPNIDINIKCGNSLISRFALDADIKKTLGNSAKWSIDSYKVAVQTYREAESKEQKREMAELIETIKKEGTRFYIVHALLNLNKFATAGKRLVEVIVMSKNSPETGIRVLNAIRHYNLDITRSAFTGGEALIDYIEAFDVGLFLSKDESDVQQIIDSGTASAALIYEPPEGYTPEKTTVRIAFDADAVLFSDESEIIYKTQGMETFHKNESVLLKEGPHARLLKMLSTIQKKMSMSEEFSPLRIAIVTARNSPSHMRVLETLRNWDVYVDEAFFLGGLSKDKILKAFKAHIFFDDQDAHLNSAKIVVPSARVPYKSNSPYF